MNDKKHDKIIRIACEGAATLPLEDLEVFQGDLKTLSEKNAARLRRVILRDGFSEPFSIWRNEGHNYILNGHQRVRVLRSLVKDGFEVGPLPVSWVEADSFKQAKMKVLDLTSQYGEMTIGGLETFLGDLDIDFPEIEASFHFPEIDLDDINLSSDTESEDEDAASEMIDRAEELQEKWQVKRGQIWEIKGKAGMHRVMCGDATDGEDVALLLDGAKPYLLITDPPYGVEYDPNWRNEAAAKGQIGYVARRIGKVQNDDRTDWSQVFAEWPCNVLYSWSPPGDHIIETGGAILRAGFQIRSQIIWRKQTFAISRGHYHWRHEPCWYAVRKGETAKWVGDRSQSTVWDIELVSDDRGDKGHGTQKPIECMRRPIHNHEGNVCDPFLGSGTTVVAAETESRVCFGMEICEKYVSVTLERLFALGLEPLKVA